MLKGGLQAETEVADQLFNNMKTCNSIKLIDKQLNSQ